MPRGTNRPLDRRRALALLAGGTAAVSMLGLGGCGGDEEAPRPELVKPEPDGAPTEPSTQAETIDTASEDEMADAGDTVESANESAPDTASDTLASDGGTPKVDKSSARAKQLAYLHDASTVSPDAQPRYEEGQHCGNCALYQGGDAAWGACPLFNGQQVKRTGWCNAYAPRGA